MKIELKRPFTLSLNAGTFFLILVAAPYLIGFVYLHEKIGGWDWVTCLRPATTAFFSLQNPYDLNACQFLSPPWTLLILAPFALLQENLGGALVGVANIVVTALAVHRMGGKPVSVIAIALSYPVIWGALLSQIDWMPMLGLLLPPQIGLFFLAVKPQIGLSVALFWLITLWKQSGIREVFRVFWPAALAQAASLVIYGLYPLRGMIQVNTEWNISPWPYAIPVGCFLIYLAVRKSKIHYAVLGSFMFSPYVNKCSLAFPLIALAEFPVLSVAASLISWILFAIYI